MIDDNRVSGVALTGSVAAGRSIAARAGQDLKPSSMELGGSDAFIVLEDADIEKTIQWAVWGRMYNAGQTCCAAKRFFVVEEVADRFLDKFKVALQALTPGDPWMKTQPMAYFLQRLLWWRGPRRLDYGTLAYCVQKGIGMTRKRGTCVLVGLRPGEFPVRYSMLWQSAQSAAPSSATARTWRKH